MDNITEQPITFCGYVAIVGRPNVGKSTLLNRLISQKVSITADKPQTTRYNVLGIKTLNNYQIVYVDTPGMHIKQQNKQMNRYMNKVAKSSLIDADIICMVVEVNNWTAEDQYVLELVNKNKSTPLVLVVNKIDRIKNKQKLLPVLQELGKKADFAEIIPLSATKEPRVELLEQFILGKIPESPFYYLPEQSTDKSDNFRITEIIREKLFRNLGQELPYSIAVELEKITEKEKNYEIYAIIWVEKLGQKQIVIGDKGAKLKQIGIESRIDIEKLLGKKLHLKLWVKVKDKWSEDPKTLSNLGFIDID